MEIAYIATYADVAKLMSCGTCAYCNFAKQILQFCNACLWAFGYFCIPNAFYEIKNTYCL